MIRTALVLLAGVLAGCASLSGRQALPDTTGLAALATWVASGRMAIAAGDEGGSGSFTWQQLDVATNLTLRGPLGAGGFEIKSDGRQLSVADADGLRLGPQAEAMLRARLGTDLPLASLRYWMIGLPDPAAVAQVRESATPPRRVIDQHGWTIAYDAFGDAGGLNLPSRLTAIRGNVRLKVSVSDWKIGSERP